MNLFGDCALHVHQFGEASRSLFAALDIATGQVIGKRQKRHRHQEFNRFLNQIDQTIPVHQEIHLVLDNYGTHRAPKVAQWLQKRPRYHLHFTPTSSSWLNQVERWFSKITQERIRRGVFKSVDSLIAAIDEYIAEHNRTAKPFVWTADADLILDRVARISMRTNLSPHKYHSGLISSPAAFYIQKPLTVSGDSHIVFSNRFDSERHPLIFVSGLLFPSKSKRYENQI